MTKDKLENKECFKIMYKRGRNDQRKEDIEMFEKILDKYKSVCLDEGIMKELKQKLGEMK